MFLSAGHLKLGTRTEVGRGAIGARFLALEVRMGRRYAHVPVLFSSWKNVPELDFYAWKEFSSLPHRQFSSRYLRGDDCIVFV
jgi:hypothetical protein